MKRIHVNALAGSTSASGPYPKRQRPQPEAPKRGLFELPKEITDAILLSAAQDPGSLKKFAQVSHQASALVDHFAHRVIDAKKNRQSVASLGGVRSLGGPKIIPSHMQKIAEAHVEQYFVPMEQRELMDCLDAAHKCQDFHGALKLSNHCIGRWPAQETWRLAKADALAGLRKYCEAKLIYERVSMMKPYWHEAHIGLARTLLSLDARPQAASVTHVLELCSRALTLGEAAGEANALSGFANLKRTNVADAERHFGLALTANSSHAGAHYGLGRTALLRGEFAESEPYFRRAIELAINGDEVKAMALNGLGYVGLSQNRYKEAESHFCRAIETIGTDARWALESHRAYGAREDALDGLGYAQLGAGYYEAARQTFGRATRRDNFDRLNGMGETLWFQGHYMEAEEYYMRVVERCIDDRDFVRFSLFCGNDKPYIQLGELNAQLGHMGMAEKYFCHVLEIQSNIRAHLGLTDAYLAMGRESDSCRHERFAQELDAGDDSAPPPWALRYWHQDMPDHPNAPLL